ncbi:tetratricopeptide repeat protein [Spirillospora sp. CA-255316]
MASEAADDAWAEAAELNNRGTALSGEGRLEEAITAYQRAVEISRAAGHPKALATALDNLSVTTAWCGRIKEALAAHDEALATFRSLGDVEGESTALSNLAAIHTRAGRPRAAVAAQQRAVEVCRAAGNRSAEASACSHLGQVLAAGGNLAGSIQAHQEAVDIWRELADREAEAGELKILALRLAETGRYTAARQAADQAVEALKDIGRQTEAAALEKWRESLPANDAGEPGERTAMPQVHTVRGCVPFLAAAGAITTFLAEGSWFLVAALTMLALLGWGTCLTSLASLAFGGVIIWKYWGTWWLLGGLALLVFGATSLASGASATKDRRRRPCGGS